jgi:ferredoxin-NADP reductase/fatty acid desaturase
MTTAATAGLEATLVEDVHRLYAATKAKVGDADLGHIRLVTAYGEAIDARRRELHKDGGIKAIRRGIVLEMLYRLLQFSELGHNIIHGSYDHLPDGEEFHSERYDWDFNVDVRDWKVMHHEGHHPRTNIVGRDHDLGYSLIRGQAGQEWFGHHAAQLVLLGAVVPCLTQLTPFVVTNLARQTDGRKFFRLATLRAPARIAYRDTVRRLITEPLAPENRFLATLLSNYLGGVAGYVAVMFMVAIEHHAGDVEVFADPGPDETLGEYYARQIRGTRNFLRSRSLDDTLERILVEEVPFEPRPDFGVFYGGLDTHIEHHLFPDLPPNRQREVAQAVRDIAARHGLPYHRTPLAETARTLLKSVVGLSIPVGERELSRPLRLAGRPLALLRRLAFGTTYRSLPEAPYLDKPRFYNVPVKVLAATPVAAGQALLVRLQKPHGWHDVRWDAGAFVSLRVEVGDETLIRQYSLVTDSVGSDAMEICIKRVGGGRVSNLLNDTLRAGKFVTLVGAPSVTGGLAMTEVPPKTMFIAGGVGITPIISQLRRIARENSPSDAVLLYFNRDHRSILFERELRALARRSRIAVHFFTDAPSTRDIVQGRMSTELIRTFVADAAAREAYVCAPPQLIDVARASLADLGHGPARFHTESFIPPTIVRPDGDGSRYTVTFRRSNSVVEISGTTTLLEAAVRAGVRVPTGCQRGLCRACVTPKLSGTTQRETTGEVLDRITVCDSLACSDIELDL